MRLLGLANEAMERGGRRPRGAARGPDAFGFADQEEFAALLRGAGFEAVEVRTLDSPIAPTDRRRAVGRPAGRHGAHHEQMRAQPPEVAERVREAFTRLPRPTAPALEIPVAAVLASGRRA